jgi:hypothetical protein
MAILKNGSAYGDCISKSYHNLNKGGRASQFGACIGR